MDKWFKIKDFENYEVNSIGEVKSLPREWIAGSGSVRRHNGIILKYIRTKKGYLTVGLYNGGVKKMVKVHRIVATSFIPNPDNKPEVNHIDGDKYNNSISNLEWVTSLENNRHARENGLMKRNECGDNSIRRILYERDVISIREEYSKYEGIKDRFFEKNSDRYNVSISCIKSICGNNTWKHI